MTTSGHSQKVGNRGFHFKAREQHIQIIYPTLSVVLKVPSQTAHGPYSTESNLFYHGETTYRVGWQIWIRYSRALERRCLLGGEPIVSQRNPPRDVWTVKRQNMRSWGPLRRSIFKWFRVTIQRTVTKLACGSNVEATLLLWQIFSIYN